MGTPTFLYIFIFAEKILMVVISGVGAMSFFTFFTEALHSEKVIVVDC